jgi:hypothetical protein
LTKLLHGGGIDGVFRYIVDVVSIDVYISKNEVESVI